MRSHRRRQPIDHVLIAGDLGDLAAIQRVLSDLDPTAYGQVLIETGGSVDVPLLSAPPRVSVHLLGAGRVADSSHQAVLAARGTVLADAVETWVGEWLPVDVEKVPDAKVWIGGRDSQAMTDLYRSLPVLAQRL